MTNGILYQDCQDIDSRKEIASRRTKRERWKLFAIRFAIFIIVAIILGGSLYAIFEVTKLSMVSFSAI